MCLSFTGSSFPHYSWPSIILGILFTSLLFPISIIASDSAIWNQRNQKNVHSSHLLCILFHSAARILLLISYFKHYKLIFTKVYCILIKNYVIALKINILLDVSHRNKFTDNFKYSSFHFRNGILKSLFYMTQ